MRQQNLFDNSEYEYLLVIEPHKAIIDCISAFKSNFHPSHQNLYFKQPHVSVGHFITGESGEDDIVSRLDKVMKLINPFSLIYVTTEFWNKNVHMVFRFESEYFTNRLIPEIRGIIGRNCASGVPHVTIMKKEDGIQQNYSLELPVVFSFECNEIILLKRQYNARDSYRIIKRFSLH